MREAITTPVTRALDRLGIAYRLRVHVHVAVTAETAALERGVRLSQIVKTMVVMRHGGRPALGLLPGHRKLSLRRLAAALGERKVRMASPEEVLSVTGFAVGSVSPLGVTTPDLPVLVDREVLAETVVDVSAGRPDAGVELSAADLLRAVGGTIVDISEIILDGSSTQSVPFLKARSSSVPTASQSNADQRLG